jgi:cation-transporting P-type ATPase 13A2
MAVCHSLALLHGELLGDPLDIQMFRAAEWTLADDPSTQGVTVSSKFNKDSFSLLKYFEFSSLLQRMSVIARHNQTGDIYVFCKGAPETIKTFCVSETVPRDFDQILTSYTHQGKRVIGLSSKNLGRLAVSDALKITRQEAELDLEFQALFILQNKLKGDTADVIRRLTEGRVSSIMVTGDNEYTAINVARECGILEPGLNVYMMRLDQSKDNQPEVVFDYVPPSSDMGHYQQQEATRSDIDWYDPKVGLAVHAKAFQYIMSVDPGMFTRMLDKAVVYARMSPLNKARLVENLQSQRGLTVGMCGDGSNDCGALKAADVGLSLSEAEASAAAPFTSKRPTIESVYLLLREGRCALATSIQVYKYMGIYSMIQTASIIILYSIGYESRLKDPQFLWIDLGLIFPLAFLST